jgi:hypothetical protein
MPTKCDICKKEDWAMHICNEGTICCDCMNEIRKKKQEQQNDKMDIRRPIRPT